MSITNERIEVAFKVVKGSEMYNRYFSAKEEKQKLHDLAREFFKSNDLLNAKGYYQRESLGLELTEDQIRRFGSQLKKNPDKNGFYTFKKNSEMQKAWESQVTSNVDMDKIFRQKIWYWDYIDAGSCAIWDSGDEVYGYLSSNREIKLSDDMEQIKLSDYYKAVEEK